MEVFDGYILWHSLIVLPEETSFNGANDMAEVAIMVKRLFVKFCVIQTIRVCSNFTSFMVLYKYYMIRGEIYFPRILAKVAKNTLNLQNTQIWIIFLLESLAWTKFNRWKAKPKNKEWVSLSKNTLFLRELLHMSM